MDLQLPASIFVSCGMFVTHSKTRKLPGHKMQLLKVGGSQTK